MSLESIVAVAGTGGIENSSIEDMIERIREMQEFNENTVTPEGQHFVNSVSSALLEAKDADKDGVISAHESALPDPIFKKLDTNKNGYINAMELSVYTAKVKNSIPDMADLIGIAKGLPSPENIRDIMQNLIQR